MKFYTDGWMMGSKNPSPYGGGFTVTDEKGNVVIREEINQEGFTNNEAEIRGIKFALEYAVKGDTVSTDSMCCLTWVRKGRSKARPDLYELLQECNFILKEKNINLIWEGRDNNLAGIYNESISKEETKKRKENPKPIKPKIESEIQTLIRMLDEKDREIKELRQIIKENEEYLNKVFG